MVTTNLPQLVHQLARLGAVRICDRMDTIVLHLAKSIDLGQVDDLLCDALFVDPLFRLEKTRTWCIELFKRDHLRAASDMDVEHDQDRLVYVLRPVA